MRYSFHLWVFIILLVSFYQPVSAQSFDCDKATSEIEKKICKSDGLKSLDVEMTALYQESLMIPEDEDPDGLARALRISRQEEWLKRRESTNYLDATYRDRIRALKKEKDDRDKFYEAETPGRALALMKKTEEITRDDFAKLLNKIDINDEILKYYISRGGDINGIDNNGFGFLHTTRRPANLIFLMKSGADITITVRGPGGNNDTLVTRWIESTHITSDVWKTFRDLGGNLNEEQRFLSNAPSYPKYVGYMATPELIDIFLDLGAKPPSNFRGVCMMLGAQLSGSGNINLFTPKMQAAMKTENIDFNMKGPDGETLMSCVKNRDVMMALMDMNVDLMSVDKNGTPSFWMPLWESRASFTVLKKLEARGADFSITDKNGQTLLMMLLSKSGTPSNKGLIYIIDKETDFKRRDDSGANLFINAAKGALREPLILKRLAEKGADVDAVDNEGKTALSHVCSAKYFSYVLFDWFLGVSSPETVRRKDNSGQTALDYCEKRDERRDGWEAVLKSLEYKMKEMQ